MERLPAPVFWPGEFSGLYGPWGHKESDTTGQISLSLSEMIICSPSKLFIFPGLKVFLNL